MTLQLTGYEILSQLHESVNSIVYRGVRVQDQLPVIIKLLKKDYPTPEEITRYKLEYQITRSLNLDGVIRTYGLEQHHNTFVMFLEDFGGESLEKFTLSQKNDLSDFLELAIRITESLDAIHAANIIHKDINPSNIVFNPETKQLKIIDFGIATELSRESLIPQHPNVIEGTLAYLSPE